MSLLVDCLHSLLRQIGVDVVFAEANAAAHFEEGNVPAVLKAAHSYFGNLQEFSDLGDGKQLYGLSEICRHSVKEQYKRRRLLSATSGDMLTWRWCLSNRCRFACAKAP